MYICKFSNFGEFVSELTSSWSLLLFYFVTGIFLNNITGIRFVVQLQRPWSNRKTTIKIFRNFQAKVCFIFLHILNTTGGA